MFGCVLLHRTIMNQLRENVAISQNGLGILEHKHLAKSQKTSENQLRPAATFLVARLLIFFIASSKDFLRLCLGYVIIECMNRMCSFGKCLMLSSCRHWQSLNSSTRQQYSTVHPLSSRFGSRRGSTESCEHGCHH